MTTLELHRQGILYMVEADLTKQIAILNDANPRKIPVLFKLYMFGNGTTPDNLYTVQACVNHVDNKLSNFKDLNHMKQMVLKWFGAQYRRGRCLVENVHGGTYEQSECYGKRDRQGNNKFAPNNAACSGANNKMTCEDHARCKWDNERFTCRPKMIVPLYSRLPLLE